MLPAWVHPGFFLGKTDTWNHQRFGRHCIFRSIRVQVLYKSQEFWKEQPTLRFEPITSSLRCRQIIEQHHLVLAIIKNLVISLIKRKEKLHWRKWEILSHPRHSHQPNSFYGVLIYGVLNQREILIFSSQSVFMAVYHQLDHTRFDCCGIFGTHSEGTP